MLIAPNTTGVSIDVFFADDSGAALVGKVAADFPACKWSGGANAADTAIVLSDLPAITTAHPNDNLAGGIKEREGGWYRLDLPNNIFTVAGRKTITFAETINKRILAPLLDVQIVSSSAPTAAQIAAQTDAQLTGSHGTGQWGGQTIVGTATPAAIAPILGDFTVGTGAYWRQTVSATGLDSTSWKSFVLTIKRSAEKDEDQAALLVIRISNPAAAGDGLLVLRGVAAIDPTLASLQVNSVSPDTSVTWTIAAAAMDINPSALEPYSWELTRFM